MSFLSELKRRNVLRAAVLYIGAVWALSQGISQLSGPLGLANWVTVWFLVACAIGFPFWIAFAWYYAITPQGIKRESDLAPGASISHSTARKLDFAIIGVLALAVVLLATQLLWHKAVPPTAKTVATAAVPSAPASAPASAVAAQPIPAKSIAVLPFENLSGDKDNAYFVAGMQDLILTKLADINDLKVIARTSTAKYASHPENLTQIGQQLGVATILEGSVQKQGNEVLINVQLIDCKTDAHIWAKAYTRTLTDVFGVEGKVAGQIAASLDARLSLAQSAALAAVPTTNHAAYDAYLRAEYQANQAEITNSTANMKAAISLYRQAVQADPDFALAWARLSLFESQLAWFGGGEDAEQLNQQARADVERALQLHPDLAAGQVALGLSYDWGRGDFAAALKAFAAALKLKPNDSDALAAQGAVERRMGRLDAAITSFQRALALDPRNSALAFELGLTYMMASRYPEAEQAFQQALAIDPHNLNAKINYSSAILSGTGDIPRALAEVQGEDPPLKFARFALLICQRKYAEALAVLGSIPDTPDNFPPSKLTKAQAEADLLAWQMGDTERARPLFMQALAQSRAQLKGQQGLILAHDWQNIADEDLGLGHAAQGLAAIAKAQAIVDKTPDQTYAIVIVLTEANLYAEAHRPDLAVPLLAKALASPGIGADYSPVMLWLDPTWDPIRHDPRFQALLQKYAQYKPVVIPAAPASVTAALAS